ncbi:hypothetical protein AVEN_8185-1 [Araneus ventricosus]|uniref:Uncharacterized protein n=1 Tax=Araneus ventricosus TaxID=182803 RepID=A0A4Y2SPF9_ARAVE|nr:hypothetical protein AVEN_8185-1 [Araneus ventricosus]
MGQRERLCTNSQTWLETLMWHVAAFKCVFFIVQSNLIETKSCDYPWGTKILPMIEFESILVLVWMVDTGKLPAGLETADYTWATPCFRQAY